MQKYFTIPLFAKLAVTFLFGIVFLQHSSQAESDNASSKVERFQKLVEKWVGVQEEIATEKREWKRQKQLLQSEIDALESKKKELSEKIRKNSRQTEDLRVEKEKLAKTSAQLKNVLSGLSSDLDKTEQFLLERKEQLPDFMRDRMRKQFNQLSAYHNDSEKIDRLGDRFNLVMSVIKSLHEADNSLHAKSTVVETSNGQELEVKALYLGLSKAFAVSPDGSFCAAGVPGEKGWGWTRKPGLADKVQKSIAVFEQDKEAAFVNLPLSVDRDDDK